MIRSNDKARASLFELTWPRAAMVLNTRIAHRCSYLDEAYTALYRQAERMLRI